MCVPGSPVQRSLRAFAGRISAPLCKGRCGRLQSESRLPCANVAAGVCRANLGSPVQGEPRTHSIASVRNSEFRIPHSALLCAATPSKCARTARTPSFFMRPKGALHAPEACFMRRRRASFAKQKTPLPRRFFCSLTYLCKLQCLFRCQGHRAEAHRRI